LHAAASRDSYVFYDGPPFATGLPHYGHLLAGTIKDIVPRYWTMRGRYVERRFGWDCHGLPVENEMEREFRVSGKRDNRKTRHSSVQRGVPFDRTALHLPVGAGGQPDGPVG